MQLARALLGFAVVALLTVVPGLDTALVLRSSVTRSRGPRSPPLRSALTRCVGVTTGDSLGR